jgi:RND family efflux transporter MFP subunit
LTFGTSGELTDGQLLERFSTLEGADAERAFASLVERHGPMVMRVCRSVLAGLPDAEDAFQATFLVLARKARSLWVHDSLGPWLHQVALRTASGARAAAARRRRHEQVAALSKRECHMETADELGHVLHEEIERLPDRFRVPVILCDLEGSTHEQAARHLGWPVGTVKSRLIRARARLRERLTRRGLAPSASLMAAVPRPTGIAEGIPAALVSSTLSAAVRFATPGTILRGSATVLARGVLRAMFTTRWLKVASVLVLSTSTVSGLGVLAWSRASGGGPMPQAAGGPTPAAAQRTSSDVQIVQIAPVKYGRFKLAVVERGSLEAAQATPVFSRVDWQTTILSLAPEGAHVKKGDLICELDSAFLRDQLTNQMITTRSAEAAFQNARLTREVAEIAVTEYEEGIYVQDRATVMGELKLAESAQKQAKERVERIRRARQKLTETLNRKSEPTTSTDVLAELDIDLRIASGEHELLRETLSLEKAQSRLNVLENYIKGKTIKELRSEVEKARADEMAKQQRFRLERTKGDGLERQIAACKITAPSDGIIVRANDWLRTGEPSTLGENSTVRGQQLLVQLVDLRSRLQVNAKIPEPLINRLTPGQKARIQIDGLPDESYTGVVAEVAPLPDPLLRTGRRAKVFTAKVKLDRPEAKLRPGMIARVAIPFAERENIVMVPRSAVLHFDQDNKDIVKVKKPDGSFESREVMLGDMDETATLIEIKQGLWPGDQVALSPEGLMTEHEKTKRALEGRARSVAP